MAFTFYSFNQGEGKVENAIVTSTGQFVIAWDFAKGKKGFLDRYEIKKYEDHVVQDNFKFGDDKEIVSLSLSSSFGPFWRFTADTFLTRHTDRLSL